MGYRKKKLKVEGEIKRLKKIVLFVLLFALLSLCGFSAFVPAQSWKYYFGIPKINSRADGELRMHFINVGQGDSSLIEFPDGKTMLIDGGDASEDTSKAILRYLNALDIDKIDYLLLTHSDTDHVGGLDKVVKYKDIGIAYLPKVNEEVNKQYLEFYTELMEKDVKTEYSKKSILISSDMQAYPYTLSFLYPYTIEVEDESLNSNDMSAVFWLDYFGVSTLFTGDAPTKIEDRLIQDSQLSLNPKGVDLGSTEILKVAHHGSKDSTSESFLEYLNVETALISCSKDNRYKHPHEELCSRLEKFDIMDYRTYRDGNIMITIGTNGNYEVDCIPS